MSDIQNYLNHISTKEWASEVRTAIVNAIRECYNNTEDPELRTDALEAAIQVKIDTGQMAALTIGDGTITAVKLASNSVTTSKIADGNVTTPKIADGSITQEKLDPNMKLVTIDATLSKSGEAADAKATGDAITELNGSLEEFSIWDRQSLNLLLILLKKTAYTDSRAGKVLDNMEMLLNKPANLSYFWLSDFKTLPPQMAYKTVEYLDEESAYQFGNPQLDLQYGGDCELEIEAKFMMGGGYPYFQVRESTSASNRKGFWVHTGTYPKQIMCNASGSDVSVFNPQEADYHVYTLKRESGVYTLKVDGEEKATGAGITTANHLNVTGIYTPAVSASANYRVNIRSIKFLTGSTT